MLLAAYNLVRFDHVSQQLSFRVLVATKCRCCCTQVDDAEFNLLAVEWDETTVDRQRFVDADVLISAPDWSVKLPNFENLLETPFEFGLQMPGFAKLNWYGN